MNLNLNYQGLSFGSNAFWQTPLGEATRHAIQYAVHDFAVAAAEVPWRGHVVEFDGEKVFINAGRNTGLQAGDEFLVKRTVKKFTDPETGVLLGAQRVALGTVEVTAVLDKLAYGRFEPYGQVSPRRGDLVVTTVTHTPASEQEESEQE